MSAKDRVEIVAKVPVEMDCGLASGYFRNHCETLVAKVPVELDCGAASGYFKNHCETLVAC